MRRLLVILWRELLATLDALKPGWQADVRPPAPDPFGGPLSPESLHYWTQADRVRRGRD